MPSAQAKVEEAKEDAGAAASKAVDVKDRLLPGGPGQVTPRGSGKGYSLFPKHLRVWRLVLDLKN